MSDTQPMPDGVVAAVTFTQAARPEAATLVTLRAFDGPLGLLLSLIEQRRLDILTVPLGDLAGAYLDALASLPGERLRHVSAFVTIASQLILIKSRALLPRPPAPVESPDDESVDPEEVLRERLLLYRMYREAGRVLADRPSAGYVSFHREASAAGTSALAAARLAPGRPLDASILTAALTAALHVVAPPPPPPEIVARTVTLAERTAAVRAALAAAPVVVLQELLHGVRDRVVIAVTFLAVLELARQREVSLHQAEPWGPITCRATGARTTGAPATGSR